MAQPQRTQKESSSPRKYAFLVTIAAMVFGILVNMGYTTWTLHDSQRAQVHERQQQLRQGRVIQRKICTTLDRLGALTPPAGNPRTNPSRAYDQKLHSTLAQLGPDIGCPRRG